MSALPPKADISERHRHVRFVPKADIAAGSSAIGSNVGPQPGLPDCGQRNWPHCEPCVRHHSLTLPGAKAATRADT